MNKDFELQDILRLLLKINYIVFVNIEIIFIFKYFMFGCYSTGTIACDHYK